MTPNEAVEYVCFDVARTTGTEQRTGKSAGKNHSGSYEHYYEQKYRQHLVNRLHKQAALFGLQLTFQQSSEGSVS